MKPNRNGIQKIPALENVLPQIALWTFYLFYLNLAFVILQWHIYTNKQQYKKYSALIYVSKYTMTKIK